jgi:hypothetical protein
VTSPAILSAKIYGLGMAASGSIGAALQSLAAANQCASQGTVNQDVRDAIGRALLLLQDASSMLLEADRMIREPMA